MKLYFFLDSLKIYEALVLILNLSNFQWMRAGFKTTWGSNEILIPTCMLLIVAEIMEGYRSSLMTTEILFSD